MQLENRESGRPELVLSLTKEEQGEGCNTLRGRASVM